MSRSSFNGMPSRRSPELPRPGIILGIVTESVVINGRVFVDVTVADTGQSYSKCPLMMFGGGPDRFVYFPVTKQPDNGPDLEVLLIPRSSAQGTPWALGMKQPVGLGITPTTADDPGRTEDHAAEVSKDDVAIKNSGAYMIIDSNGAVTIAPGNTAAVRVQLPDSDDAVFRVSLAGEAGERLILADQFLDTWVNSTLYNHLSDQDSRITSLERQVAALTVAGKTAVAVNGSKLTAFDAVSTFSGAGSKTPPKASSENKSDIFAIPSKAVGD